MDLRQSSISIGTQSFHHKPTLKRVIYHERDVDLDDEFSDFELFADNMLSWDGSMFDLFRGGNLEYVELCDFHVLGMLLTLSVALVRR